MSARCPLCRESFAAHVAVRARCRARWRGASFDAAAAKANAGLAIVDLLGLPVRDRGALAAFESRVRVEAYRETPADALNPVEAFDPEAAGEWWEFHVGFREAADASLAPRAREAALAAVAKSRNFLDASVVPETVP